MPPSYVFRKINFIAVFTHAQFPVNPYICLHLQVGGPPQPLSAPELIPPPLDSSGATPGVPTLLEVGFNETPTTIFKVLSLTSSKLGSVYVHDSTTFEVCTLTYWAKRNSVTVIFFSYFPLS